MGKIRVKTFDESGEEKKNKKLEQKRAEKKVVKEPVTEATQQVVVEEVSPIPQEQVKAKKEKFAEKKNAKHSTKYQDVAAKVDRTKVYDLSEALALLPQLKRASFDETVELHINTLEKGVSGSMTLPHGTGKQVRVAIASDEVIKQVEAGNIDFDILLAEPTMMPKLAKVARVLGPRGLMPNPKNGTVTPKPEEAAKKYAGGQVNFKTEAKFPLLHLTIGKVSFGENKLADNIKTAIEAIDTKNIKSATLKSTMSPGLKLNVASL